MVFKNWFKILTKTLKIFINIYIYNAFEKFKFANIVFRSINAFNYFKNMKNLMTYHKINNMLIIISRWRLIFENN